MSAPEVEFPEKFQPLFQPHRYKVLYGGRGAAKSWGVARALLLKGWERPLRFLCTREIQKSIDDSVHQLLKDQVSALGLDAFYEVQGKVILGKNGTQFSFAGLRDQNVTSIKSFEGIDVCWVEEAQTVSKKSWDILIPTIRKEQSEIWVTFNPELDTDETYKRFVEKPPPESVVVKVGWQDNPWFPEVLRKEKDHLQNVDPEAYEQVWEGHCRTVVAGAIYKNEILKLYEDKRVRQVPYDPMLKVHTVWDLGWNDQTTIIFAQRLGGEMRLIDYYEKSHTTYADDVAMLEKKGYRYGRDFLPHDAKAETKAANGKSAEELLRALGRNTVIVPNLDVEQGIKSARITFSRCYFDADKTQRLVDCLKRYRRRINSTTNEPEGPLHDEYSHGADAFRYMAVIADQMDNAAKPKTIKYPSLGVV